MSNTIDTVNVVMTFAEAAEKWDLGESTLRSLANSGGFERRDLKYNTDYVKSGKVWLVTRMAMMKLYGPPKHKLDRRKPKKKAQA